MTAFIKRKSFLVIDDQAFQRALTGETLRALGASRIENAENVATAIEICRRGLPDVVLCDWEMPDVDGLAFTRAVRRSQTPLPKAAPIILMTHRTTQEDVNEARKAGVDEFAVKPFTTQVLASRIESVVLRQRPFVDCAHYVGPCRRRKLDSHYEGVRRRLFDETPEGETPVQREMKARANALLGEVRPVIMLMAPTDRTAIRRLHTFSQEMKDLAGGLKDPLLRGAADSLTSYIAGVGASGAFDPRVAEAHLDAMTQLVNLPGAHQELRDQVARALRVLVQKKLNSAA